jgi:hypothetical protein
MDNYFSDGHLNEQSVALCAEAMVFDRENNLPADIRNHVKECGYCQDEIFAVYDMIRDNKALKAKDMHPFFGRISTPSRNTSYTRIYPALRIAAIFVLLTGMGSLAYYLVSRLHTPTQPCCKPCKYGK